MYLPSIPQDTTAENFLLFLLPPDLTVCITKIPSLFFSKPLAVGYQMFATAWGTKRNVPCPSGTGGFTSVPRARLCQLDVTYSGRTVCRRPAYYPLYPSYMNRK